MCKRELDQMTDAMRQAGGDYVVFRHVLLQHQPHRTNIIAGKTPVALDVEITHAKFVLQPEFNASHVVTDSTSYKLDAAPRRLVVKQDSRAGKKIVTFACVDRNPMTVELCNSIGAAGIKAGSLGLRGFLRHTKHLAGRSLIEADRGIYQAHSFEQSSHAQSRELAR